MSDASERMQRLFDRRKAAGRCVRCEVYLPDGYAMVRCQKCLEHKRRGDADKVARDVADSVTPYWRAQERVDAEIAAGQRCPRCALLLPCECLAGIVEVAGSRNGSSTGLT